MDEFCASWRFQWKRRDYPDANPASRRRNRTAPFPASYWSESAHPARPATKRFNIHHHLLSSNLVRSTCWAGQLESDRDPRIKSFWTSTTMSALTGRTIYTTQRKKSHKKVTTKISSAFTAVLWLPRYFTLVTAVLPFGYRGSPTL